MVAHLLGDEEKVTPANLVFVDEVFPAEMLILKNVQVAQPSVVPDLDGLRIHFSTLSRTSVYLTINFYRDKPVAIEALAAACARAVFPATGLQH